MNLPLGCSERDIDKRFGDEVLDDENSRLCECCSERFLWEDLRCVCPESSIYLCDCCLTEQKEAGAV